jgi:hypothetical protein
MANSISTVGDRPHLKEFLGHVNPSRGRLIFALDATASRQPTWDAAAQLTSQMFGAVAAIGGLDLQLVYYRGEGECVASKWLSDAKALSAAMQRVMCMAGYTQIGRVLRHARKESAREKIGALILISDAKRRRCRSSVRRGARARRSDFSLSRR